MALLSYAGLWKVWFSPFIQANVWFLLVRFKKKMQFEKVCEKGITSSVFLNVYVDFGVLHQGERKWQCYTPSPEATPVTMPACTSELYLW